MKISHNSESAVPMKFCIATDVGHRIHQIFQLLISKALMKQQIGTFQYVQNVGFYGFYGQV